jgi:hypothetical protein
MRASEAEVVNMHLLSCRPHPTVSAYGSELSIDPRVIIDQDPDRPYVRTNWDTIRCTEIEVAMSCYDPGFEYKKGAIVGELERFCMKPLSCAEGIHFFVNLREALAFRM